MYGLSQAAPSASPGFTGTAIVQSGVQRLNNDLTSVFDRIQNMNLRVIDLANQFGAPENPSANPPEGPVISTNEHMGNLHRALSRLEASIARIDNQG